MSNSNKAVRVFKKVFAAILSISLVASLAACNQQNSASTAPVTSGTTSAAVQPGGEVKFNGEIKIGVSTGITGVFPLAGTRTQQGIQLAVDEINAKGGLLGKKVVLEVVDDQSNTAVVINAVNRLISDPDVVAVIGPHQSGNVMATSDLFKNAKVPFLSGGTSPKLDTLSNPELFTIRPSDNIAAEAVAQFAQKTLGAKKIGLSYNNNDFGSGGKMVIEKYCQENNLQLVEEGHNSGDKDLTGQIMKFKSENVDCVISWTDDAEVALTARQTYQLNLNKPVLCSAGITMKQVLDLVDAKYIENWYAETDFTINDTSDTVTTFSKKFEEKYNIKPELYASAYYGAMLALGDAITRAGSTDREAIRTALAQTKDVPGIVGTLTSDKGNHMAHEVRIVQFHNKEAKVLNVVKVD